MRGCDGEAPIRADTGMSVSFYPLGDRGIVVLSTEVLGAKRFAGVTSNHGFGGIGQRGSRTVHP